MGDEDRTATAKQQAFDEIFWQPVRPPGAADNDQVMVSSTEQDVAKGVAVPDAPTRRDEISVARTVAHLDSRTGAEIRDMPRGFGGVPDCAALDVGERVRERRTNREIGVGNICCGLSGAKMDVQEVQVAGKGARGGECRGKYRQV